jgi:hypothetical protein
VFVPQFAAKRSQHRGLSEQCKEHPMTLPIGLLLAACGVRARRRRLATVGELFEGDGQDANGTEPTAMDRHGAARPSGGDGGRA